MNVLIAGANGTTGRLLIEQIAKEGEHRAIAMVRDPKQEPELEKLGAQTVVGDLEGDVSHAIHLADAVIFAAGSGSKTGPDKTISVDQEGAKNLIDEAKNMESNILSCLVQWVQTTRLQDHQIWSSISWLKR